MAFYDEELDEQQDPNATQQPQISGGSQVVGAGGGQAASAGAGQGALSPDSASNFVGIKQYIDANKPQSERLAGQVGGVIDESANQARSSAGSFAQNAAQSIQPTQSLSADLIAKIGQNPEDLTDEERAQARQTSQAQYTGPQTVQDIGGYQDAATSSIKARQNLQNAQMEGGKTDLIKQVNKAPRTSGMNTLDTALLSAGGGEEVLSQAVERNKDAPSSFDQALQTAQQQIGRLDDPSTPDIDESAGAMGQTAKAQKDAYSAINEALTNWTSGYDKTLRDAREAFATSQGTMRKDLDSLAMLSPETLQALGLQDFVTPQGVRTYGLDLNSYLTQGSPTDITAQNLAKDEDYARYLALADMAGLSPEEMLLTEETRGQAGTVINPFTMDSEKFKADVKAKEEAYNQAFKTQKGIASLAANSTIGKTIYKNDVPNLTAESIQNTWLPQAATMMTLYPGQGYEQWFQALRADLENFKSNNFYNTMIKQGQD